VNNPKTYVVQIGDKSLTIETGLLAQQAGGAVTVQLGDSIVLCTATASKKPREGIDFFPLTVDFEERLYAAGRIPGSFFRREGRPSESAILTARLIDRPLRPLFPKDYHNDVQVIATALSSDGQNYLDIPAIIGASTALMISDVPFETPVGACRVGLVEDQFIINPTADEMEESALDIRMAGTEDAILMVEAGAHEVHEEVVLQALKTGHEAMQPVIALQKRMREEVGKPKNFDYPVATIEERDRERILSRIGDRVAELVARPMGKKERSLATEALENEILGSFAGDETINLDDVKTVFREVLKAETRKLILEKGQRADGRTTEEIRPIWTKAGFLPRAHGSGLFTRGGSKSWTPCGPKRSSATCIITTFRPLARAKRGPCAVRGGVRSAMGHWQKRRCALCSQPRKSSLTPSAWCPSACHPTAPPRWPRSAAAPWPSWTPVCR